MPSGKRNNALMPRLSPVGNDIPTGCLKQLSFTMWLQWSQSSSPNMLGRERLPVLMGFLFFTCCHSGNKKHKKKRKAATGDPVDAPAIPANQPVDKSYLCCAHHRAMVAGLCLLKNPERLPGKQRNPFHFHPSPVPEWKVALVWGPFQLALVLCLEVAVQRGALLPSEL